MSQSASGSPGHFDPPEESVSPHLARRLLSLVLPERYREDQLGDLEEAFGRLRERSGLRQARRWYWKQVVTSILPTLRLRVRDTVGARPRSPSMQGLMQDLKYGLRSLVKSPSYAIVAITTLALAIGVNTAIFSLVSVVTVSDVPMDDPETLGWVTMSNTRTGRIQDPVSFPDLIDFRERNRSFEGLAALQPGASILSDDSQPERVSTYRTTDNLFSVWRIPMALGRGFSPGEDRADAARVVLLSHSYWSVRFGADPTVLGTSVRVDGVEHTVVGVVTPDMEFGQLGQADVWLPMGLEHNSVDRDQRSLLVSGRLLPGVSLAQANDDLAGIAASLGEQHPSTNGAWISQVRTTEDMLLPAEISTIFALLGMGVTFVLLIACTNVANMLLARSTSRSRELAVRSALGAGKGRIVRQLLTESLMVSMVAGSLGLLLASGLLDVLVRLTRGQTLFFSMAQIDRDVLLFTVLVSMAAPVVFALAPALRAARSNVANTLREAGGRGSTGRHLARVRGLLVSGQVALALMLMVMAGIAARSVIAIQSVDRGYDEEALLSAVLQLPEADYPDPSAQLQFGESVLRELESASGVAGAALVSGRPGFWAPGSGRPFEIEGRPAANDQDLPRAVVTIASHTVLEVMGIPLEEGRSFVSGDGEGSVPVALVSRAAAQLHWPEQDPVGQRIRMIDPAQGAADDGAGEWVTIVGIAGDSEVGDNADLEPPAQIILPFAQNPLGTTVVMIRSQSDPAELVEPLRAAVWAVDGNQPVDDVKTMLQYRYDVSSTDYALITLFSTLALFALLMSAMGIYGVMSYLVASRRSEFGLRLALGARPGAVRMMVLGQGAKLLVLGGIVGLAGALALTRVTASLVIGISPADPVTLIGVPVILGAIALAANYVPALRATRIDPMVAMRAD